MSSKIKFFITGSTGYIGGSVLTRLLVHPRRSDFDITVLIRNKDKAAFIQSHGVTTVIGDYSDLDKLEAAASAADVTIAAVDCDNVAAAKAILSGLKTRHEKTGKAPAFIHTSGTAVYGDLAYGMTAGGIVYDDNDADQIESIHADAPHRPVDLEIVNADKEGYAKTYIVVPSMVYGIVKSPLVDAGYQKARTIMMSLLINFSTALGKAAVVGKGANIWSSVDIDDTADLYIVLLDAILEGKPIGHGREGFYNAANGEFSLSELAEALGRELVSAGKIKSPEPVSFTDDELKTYLNPLIAQMVSSNSRCTSNRSRAVGWNPTKTTEDLWASLKDEVEVFFSKGASYL